MRDTEPGGHGAQNGHLAGLEAGGGLALGLRGRGFEVMTGTLRKWRQDLRMATTGWLWREADGGGELT